MMMSIAQSVATKAADERKANDAQRRAVFEGLADRIIALPDGGELSESDVRLVATFLEKGPDWQPMTPQTFDAAVEARRKIHKARRRLQDVRDRAAQMTPKAEVHSTYDRRIKEIADTIVALHEERAKLEAWRADRTDIDMELATREGHVTELVQGWHRLLGGAPADDSGG